VSIGLIFLYLAVIVLGIFPVARTAFLRKTYSDPFLARFQAFALLLSLGAFADLIIRFLGPRLNVIRPEQRLNLSMLFGFILIPSMIALCYLFIRLVFALLQKPVPRPLMTAFVVFWGIFFIGFVFAEVRYFQTGSMSATRFWEIVFNAGLTACFFGANLILWVRASYLQDRGRTSLARTLAIAYFAGFLIPLSGRLFASNLVRQWMIFEYLFLLVFNAGIAVFIESHLRRHAQPAGVGNEVRVGPEIFARFRITRREQDVVRGILEGRSNAEIATAFFISEKTVETHVYNVYQKTGVKSRVQLLNLFRGNSKSTSELD
jgi:DNA-binding CsgD family transcriptional regulator